MNYPNRLMEKESNLRLIAWFQDEVSSVYIIELNDAIYARTVKNGVYFGQTSVISSNMLDVIAAHMILMPLDELNEFGDKQFEILHLEALSAA